MKAYKLRTNIQANEEGRIETANEQNRRLISDIWMPASRSSAVENTANFHDAIVDAIAAYRFGGRLRIPNETYPINELLIEDVLGLEVVGVGGQSRFLFNVTDGADWLTLAHCHGCDFSHLILQGNTGIARSAIASLRTNLPNLTYAPSHNKYVRVVIEGTNHTKTGLLISGTRTEDGISGDQNNDFNYLEHCVIQGYTERGIDTRYMLQSYNNRLVNTRLYGGAGALYGIDMTANVGGAVNITDGFIGGHAEADLQLGRSSQACTFINLHSENSKRLLIANGSHGIAHFIGGRYAGNDLHDDGRMIIVTGQYSVIFESMYFGSGSSDKTVQPTFDVNTSNVSRFVMENNIIFSKADNLFNHKQPTRNLDNLKINELTMETVLIT